MLIKDKNGLLGTGTTIIEKEREMIEFDPQSQLVSLFNSLKKVDMEMLVVADELSLLP